MYCETKAGRNRSFDDAPLERDRVRHAIKGFGQRRFPVRDCERGDWESFSRAVPLIEQMFTHGAVNGFAAAIVEAMRVAARLGISSSYDCALSLTDNLVDLWGVVDRAAVVGYIAIAYVKGADYWDVYLRWRDVPEVVEIARHAVNCFDNLDTARYDSNVHQISNTQ